MDQISDKCIMITITNYGYYLYTLNMLKSLKIYNLDKDVLIITLDVKSTNLFKKCGYNVMCITTDIEKFCAWNTPGYDKVCFYKLKAIYYMLSIGKNVLLIDGDIVFNKNPLPDIIKWNNEKYDVVIQNDTEDNSDLGNLCTGYMFIRSNPQMIQLYNCETNSCIEKYKLCINVNNDQTYFNIFIKPYCNVLSMQIEYYQNGNVIYNKKYNKENAILYHFNHIKGHMKMAKMKEYKCWILTPDEEYL